MGEFTSAAEAVQRRRLPPCGPFKAADIGPIAAIRIRAIDRSVRKTASIRLPDGYSNKERTSSVHSQTFIG
jgi:hypothetical protein